MYDEQRVRLDKANLESVAYELGLKLVEAQLVQYQKNEVILEEKIGVLEWQVKDKTNLLTYHKTLLDLATKEKEEILKEKEDLKAKLEKFENSSKNLTKLLDSQISPKVKIGLGYGKEETICDVSESDVSETVFDSSTSDKENRLDDSVYTSTAVTKDAPKSNEVFVETPKEVKSSAPLIQDWDTNSDNESIFRPKQVFEKVNFVKECEYVRPVKHAKSVKIAKSVRPITPVKPIQQTEKPKESCSSPKNGYLGTGQRVNKPVWNYANRINHQNQFVPRAVLLRSGKIPVSTAKPKQAVSTSVPRQVNTVRPKQSVNFPKNTFNRSHSPITRSYYAPSAQRRSLSPKRVNTVRQAVNTGKGNGITAEHPHIALKDKGITESGCSRYMTGTKEYLSDYQEIKGGFIAFSEGKGRITGKGNIKTEKLDFDDVYYVNGLKFNLFSVSQMCDKKISVLFTETECLVLSLNFKLLDESQVVQRIENKAKTVWQVAAGQSERDTWHLVCVSTRLACVSTSVGSENEFVYDPNPYSYNEIPDFSYPPPQPQYETYSCELCGNDSHYGFDCPPRVPLVYEQEPCYNQNFSDNYYPQNSPSFSQQYLCCDNCGGPHATFQCHPMNQNFNSFGFDHIQPPQQFDNHQPQETPEVTPFVESKEWIETNNELYKMMEDFTERMNQELHKQEVLLAAQREQELLAQKQAAQEKQVPSPNSVFRQLIEEMCGTKVCEEQKQNMEDTMLDLLEICQQKEFYCMYNNVEDLIESALNSKLLLINLNSQRLNKEEQEVKNITEPTAKQPEDSLIMGNKELSTIPEKESDEFIKSSVEDLIPILRVSEDTSGSDSVCVLPSSDDFSPIVEEKSVTFSNPLFEFNDEYISNDVSPIFDEVLKNIECKDSYDSNLDDLALLVTPLSDANKDECFDPGGVIDEIDAFLDMDISKDIENGYHDSEGDIIYFESLLIDDTSPNLPPEVFLDHDPRSLKDEPNFVDMV
ncbi:hypothetical protein Tco_0646958 [Tanacetum coccineum]